MTELDAPRRRFLHQRQQPQHGGLPCAVEAEDHHLGSLVDGQVDGGEHLQRPVGLAEVVPAERRLAAGRGLREADLGDGVDAPLALDARHQLLGALGHVLRGDGLRGLGAHLVGLEHELGGLALGVGELALAALLVGLALEEVALPVHGVDVHLGPVGVEVVDLVDHGVEEFRVVGDHDEPAWEGLQVAAQPHHRVGVEVVGGLVEEQGLGVGEEDAGQLDASALAAGEGLQRLAQDPVRQAQVGRDPRRLGLGGVPAGRHQRGLGAGVGGHGLVADGLAVAPHAGLGAPHALDHLVESARAEDPVAGDLLGVPRSGVLRQVAELPRARDGAGGRERLAGEDAGQGGLAGAVAADEADPVPTDHLEGHRGEQQPGARAHLDVLDL